MKERLALPRLAAVPDEGGEEGDALAVLLFDATETVDDRRRHVEVMRALEEAVAALPGTRLELAAPASDPRCPTRPACVAQAAAEAGADVVLVARLDESSLLLEALSGTTGAPLAAERVLLGEAPGGELRGPIGRVLDRARPSRPPEAPPPDGGALPLVVIGLGATALLVVALAVATGAAIVVAGTTPRGCDAPVVRAPVVGCPLVELPCALLNACTGGFTACVNGGADVCFRGTSACDAAAGACGSAGSGCSTPACSSPSCGSACSDPSCSGPSCAGPSCSTPSCSGPSCSTPSCSTPSCSTPSCGGSSCARAVGTFANAAPPEPGAPLRPDAPASPPPGMAY